ncbi:prefoldin subunit alpha [Stetteria hydrogenophila]
MAKQQRRAEELVYIQSQLAAIQEQIEATQALIAQLEAAVNNLKLASDSIDGIVKHGEEVIFPLDPGFNAYTRGRPLSRDRFIVHLGLEYYAETDASTALQIIARKRGRLEKSLQELRERLNALAQLYEKYKKALAEALQAAEQK